MTTLAIIALGGAWIVGSGMILLLGWRQDGRVNKGDAWMAIAFGLAFWPILAKEMYDTWRNK